MRVGILTLPLHTNYGGILQAYALQTVLERMGHKVEVLSKPYRISLPVWKWPYSYPKRIIKRYILGKNDRIFFESLYNRAYPIIGQFTQTFIDNYIHRHEVKDWSALQEDDFDAFVVGSDQVWRPPYFPGNIENAYLAFAKDRNVRRIAYAASFGTDEWEYTARQTIRCGELARRFDVISVREESGVELCHKYLGVEANHVLDPTMLLDVNDYMQLIEKANVPQSKGNLLCYILDETEEKAKLISKLANDTGLIPFRGNSRVGDWDAPLTERIQPPVEQWLRGFYDAELVITDSFHACVFSILFNKPFVVIENKKRGFARLESLLKTFGLEECLFDENKHGSRINDWSKIEERLPERKELSLKLLYENL